MVELDVEPPVPDAVGVAIRTALADGGVALDGRHPAHAGAWRRAAAREVVDNEPVSRRGSWAVYTLSPRSTRGATRA
jgi:hypothetical protein